MSAVVTHKIVDGIAVIVINSPPVNALSQAIRAELLETVTKLNGDNAVKAMVIRSEGNAFMAGADIKEFDSAMQPPMPYDLFGAMEQSSKLVIAALHGVALGAGGELAISCHFRCATPDARIGFPEITLGILPGASGSQRLPRLIGAVNAAEMTLTGAPAVAADAIKTGLIDKIIEGDLEAGAIAYAKELLAANTKPRRTSELTTDTSGWNAEFLKEIRKKAGKPFRGQESIEWNIEAIQAAIDLPFAKGLQKETELAEKAIASDESKALRHIFFAEREVSKIPGLDKNAPTIDIKKVAVIGAGTMGGGIAMNFVNVGIPVTILDMNAEALQRGLATMRKNYDFSLKRGSLTPEKLEERMSLVSTTTNYSDLGDVDLVIEAVFENMELKQKIFKQLDEVCKPQAILATNTSTLDINEIATATSRPEKVIGLHFFSPANVMKLVEIVRPEKVSDETLATAVAICKKIRKVGVVVGVCFGFVGNRMMLEGYVREADQMILEGATPEQVDRVIYNFGFAMGPCAMNDMAGNDVGRNSRIMTGIKEQRPSPYHELVDKLAELGRFGQKSGSGFYKYVDGDRTPHHDPETDKIIEGLAAQFGIERKPLSDEEVEKRCVYSLINEGAKILEDGIAYRPGDIDVVYCFGYGFPRRRGGPMKYADLVGLDKVYADICELNKRFGDDYWKPSELLGKLAKAGKTFDQWQEV